MTARMRIVAGSARGRRLVAPQGTDVRPTGDRVREAIFNALGSADAVEDAEVLDLFAGSGALGLEALSRGAAHVTFVDSSPAAIRAVRANVAELDFEDRASVHRSDALAHARRAGPVDVALLDPPYSYDHWSELLEVLPARLAVIESDREIDPGERWRVLRQRRYGSTVVTIAERHEHKDRDEHGGTPREDRS